MRLRHRRRRARGERRDVVDLIASRLQSGIRRWSMCSGARGRDDGAGSLCRGVMMPMAATMRPCVGLEPPRRPMRPRAFSSLRRGRHLGCLGPPPLPLPSPPSPSPRARDDAALRAGGFDSCSAPSNSRCTAAGTAREVQARVHDDDGSRGGRSRHACHRVHNHARRRRVHCRRPLIGGELAVRVH